MAPEHHGDPTAEYLAVRTGAALVDPGWSAVVVEGPDAVSFLDALVSQRLVAGEARRTFLLGPRGKLRVIARVLADDERVLFTTEASRRDVLIEDLSRYRIRVKAEIRPDDRPVRLVVGSEARSLGLPVPPDGGWVRVGDGVVADAPIGPFPGLLTVGVDIPDGATPVGALAWTARRIEAGEPVMDVDVDEDTIPQETGLVAASVDFTKGCYLGQELVARIDSRGRVNRRLVGLVLGTNVIPPLGATVSVPDRALGTITSIGESLDLRAPVAMGLIRREAAVGDPVTIGWDGGEAPAVVAALPLVS